MEIVARRCPAGEIVHLAQVAPNGGWATTWSQLVPNSPGGGDGPIAVALSPDGQLGILDYRVFGGRFFSRQTDSSKHATAAMERVGEGQRRELVARPRGPDRVDLPVALPQLALGGEIEALACASASASSAAASHLAPRMRPSSLRM